jgi:hypothetical protein
MKEKDQNQIIATLQRINNELMEENEHLRKQIEALEELAIDQKGCYNDDELEEEAWEDYREDYL